MGICLDSLKRNEICTRNQGINQKALPGTAAPGRRLGRGMQAMSYAKAEMETYARRIGFLTNGFPAFWKNGSCNCKTVDSIDYFKETMIYYNTKKAIGKRRCLVGKGEHKDHRGQPPGET